MNLRVAGVCEQSAALVGTESGRHVRTLGVCRKVVDVTVTAGAKADCVTHVAFEFASDEVTDDDTASLAVDHDEVHHFAAGEHFHLTGGNLAHKSLVGSEQELLTRLTASVERTGNLRTAEGTVVEEATVFTTERNTLGDALVDDEVGVFGQAVHVGFASAEVTALHGIVEQTVNGVAVVLVVLGSVDTTLGSNGVCATGAILDAERLDIVTKFGEGSGSGCTGKASTNHDHGELTLVGGVHELEFELVLGPLFFDGTTGDFRIKNH